MICNLNPYDGQVAKEQIDQVLIDRDFNIDNFTTVIKYLDSVTNQFKSSFHALADNGSFNLYYNGFYLIQMYNITIINIRYCIMLLLLINKGSRAVILMESNVLSMILAILMIMIMG